jgi:hypothetical protein
LISTAVGPIGEWLGDLDEDQLVRVQEKNDGAAIGFSNVTFGDGLCDTLGDMGATRLTATKQCRELSPLRSVAGVQAVMKSASMSCKETG